MAWMWEDVRECTRYGHLYHVKKVRSDNSMYIRRVVFRDGMFREDGKVLLRRMDNISQGMEPEEGDFVYRCHSDKTTLSIVATLTRPHPC